MFDWIYQELLLAFSDFKAVSSSSIVFIVTSVVLLTTILKRFSFYF